MAKFPTIGKRTFGAPPPLDETHGNLAAPKSHPPPQSHGAPF